MFWYRPKTDWLALWEEKDLERLNGRHTEHETQVRNDFEGTEWSPFDIQKLCMLKSSYNLLKEIDKQNSFS